MYESMQISNSPSGTLHETTELIPIAAQIVFYRSAKSGPIEISLESCDLIQLRDFSVGVFWHKDSLCGRSSPLRYSLTVLCVATDPYHWIQMHKTGRTPRGYRPLIDDFFGLVKILFADIARFPRGFQPYLFDSVSHAITSMTLKEKCQ